MDAEKDVQDFSPLCPAPSEIVKMNSVNTLFVVISEKFRTYDMQINFAIPPIFHFDGVCFFRGGGEAVLKVKHFPVRIKNSLWSVYRDTNNLTLARTFKQSGGNLFTFIKGTKFLLQNQSKPQGKIHN